MVIAGLAVLLAGAGVRAQTLDLGVPQGLGPGEGRAILELLEGLDERIGRGLDPDPSNADRVRLGLTRLARDLIEQGERDADAGAVRVLTGLAVHARLRGRAGDQIDGWAARWDDPAEGERLATEVALGLAADWLESRADPPIGDGALDRWLRDGLAPLAGLVALDAGAGDPSARGTHPGARPGAWVGAEATAPGAVDLAAVIDRLSASPHATPSLRATLVDLAELLAAARASAPYRASGAKVERMLADAAASVRDEPRDWVPEPVARQLVRDFDDASGDLLFADRAAGAQAQLARLALIARILVGMDTAEAVQEVQFVQRGLARVFEQTSRDPEDALPLLAGLAMAAEALGDRDVLRYEPVVASPVAVGWRRLIAGHRRSETRLRREILRMVERAEEGAGGVSPLSDPSFLVGLRAHRRSVAMFDNSLALSAHLTGEDPRETYERRGGRPRVLPEHETLARRLLSFGNRFDDDDPDAADRAFGAFTRMADELARFTGMPGEGALRDAIATGAGRDRWSRVTGGRHLRLAEAIDAGRERWASAWSMPMSAPVNDPPPLGDVAGASANLERLRRVLALASDGVVLATASDDAGRGASTSAGFAVNAWPAWELSAPATRMSVGPMLERLPGLVSGAGGVLAPSGATRQLDAFEREHRLAILLARLERGVRERGLTPDRLGGSNAGLEFASGAPDPTPGRVWLVEHRRELATLCRAAEELAHARRASDRGRAARFAALVDDRAGFLLEVLDD